MIQCFDDETSEKISDLRMSSNFKKLCVCDAKVRFCFFLLLLTIIKKIQGEGEREGGEKQQLYTHPEHIHVL